MSTEKKTNHITDQYVSAVFLTTTYLGIFRPEFSELPSLLIFQVDNFGGTTIPNSYSNMSKLFKLSLRNCNLQWPILDFSRIPNLGYAQAKHWSRWSYLEEQTRMQFLLLHEVDVHEMDIHPVSNGRNLMSPSSAFLMQVITLG